MRRVRRSTLATPPKTLPTQWPDRVDSVAGPSNMPPTHEGPRDAAPPGNVAMALVIAAVVQRRIATGHGSAVKPRSPVSCLYIVCPTLTRTCSSLSFALVHLLRNVAISPDEFVSTPKRSSRDHSTVHSLACSAVLLHDVPFQARRQAAVKRSNTESLGCDDRDAWSGTQWQFAILEIWSDHTGSASRDARRRI